MHITKEMVRNIESRFMSNNYNGTLTINPNYEYINNGSNILLSAPHSVKQMREGNIKEEDELTGFYASYLPKLNKYNSIYRIYQSMDDPNYPIGETLENPEDKYLQEVIKLIKKDKISFLLDIHGCATRRPFDVEIISVNGKTCNLEIVDIFYETLRSKNFIVSVDKVFKRGGQVIRQASNAGTNAVALEINKTCRSYETLEDLQKLREMILGIDESLVETKKHLI